MKKILLIIAGLIVLGCSSKEMIEKYQKTPNSVQQQKQEADKAWRELDKE